MGFVFVRKWFDFVQRGKTCVFCSIRQIKCIFLYFFLMAYTGIEVAAMRDCTAAASVRTQFFYFLSPPLAIFFLNSDGLTSNCFLKHTLKYFALLKPV